MFENIVILDSGNLGGIINIIIIQIFLTLVLAEDGFMFMEKIFEEILLNGITGEIELLLLFM